MFNKKTFYLVVLVFSFLSSFHLVFGQKAIQRMALAKGKFTIAKKGEIKRATAYCLDQTRSAPKNTDIYTQVLSPASFDNAIVQIGNSLPISLQDAITNGDIKIKGATFTTFSDLLDIYESPQFINQTINSVLEGIKFGRQEWDRLSKEEKVKRDEESIRKYGVSVSQVLADVEKPQFIEKYKVKIQEINKKIRQEWESKSVEEQAKFDKEFSTKLSLLGNLYGGFKWLEFENLSNQSITVEIKKPAILSNRSERMPTVSIEALPEGTSWDEKTQIELWKNSTTNYQQLLKRLGYYNGEIDGKETETFLEAIFKFKEENGIKVERPEDIDKLPKEIAQSYLRSLNGAIDTLTEELLVKTVERADAISEISAKTGSSSEVLLLEYSQVGDIYPLFDKNGRQVYKGNDPSQLIEQLNKKTNGSRIGILVEGFPPNRVDALIQTIRFRKNELNSDLTLFISEKKDSSFFFEKQQEIEIKNIGKVIKDKSLGTETYTQDVTVRASCADVLVGKYFGDVNLRVFSRTSEIAKKTSNKFKSLFKKKESILDKSIADFVSDIRSDLLRESITGRDVFFQMKKELSVMHVVEIPKRNSSNFGE